MRKLFEIVLVIVAAGLAAAVALIDIPSDWGDHGTGVAGGSLLDALPPSGASTLPPIPQFTFPAAPSTPAPVQPPTTPAPVQGLDVQPSRSEATSRFVATGRLGASPAQPVRTSPSRVPGWKKPQQPSAGRSKAAPPVRKQRPPAAKSKAKPKLKKAKPPSKPKPPHPGKK
jgi:hypothetical protein